MNKGSHISLALFLLDSVDIEEFYIHKRSFLMGSILPDCLPSFLTTRHTVTETFEILKSELCKISREVEQEKDSFPMHGRLPKVDDVCDYILEKHTIYLTESHDKTIDCSYIAEVCQTVTCTIMSQLMTIPSAKRGGQIQAA